MKHWLLLPFLAALPLYAEAGKATPPANKESSETLDETYTRALKMLDGKEVPHNPAGAVQLLVKSADKGHIPSMILVASCAIEGIGTPKDVPAGVQIMHMAAKKGSAEAQRKLALLYNEGIAGARDTKTALYWFQKAADQKDALAIYFLGTFYSQGLEVKHDPNKAFELFSKAAYMNEPRAQVILAGCYTKGFGVPQDLAEAYAWALVASDNGFPDTKNQLYRMMSQKILDKARPRAKELQKKIKS